ncbi:hypothetical protein B8W66_21980 [Mycobacterium decipiens]|uniref:Uncharacterized protein n=1 Tax=Mycobacterium decipiens TaxID=1430326 RepID=A0A1X2LPG5_9MYCO|nr:hypothetical protein B8W66_21980 [Mycobacterium decipiens]
MRNVFPCSGRVLLSRSPANVIWGTCCERSGMLVTTVSLLVNQGAGKKSPRPATMDGGWIQGLRSCRSIEPVGQLSKGWP